MSPVDLAQQQPLQPQHTTSKAGRHRVYSNEQRKDRNRQAQAAFRDRRSKYQKTLEAAMLRYEDTIENLKQDNVKSIQRAEAAEERCVQLDSEVANLQKLLQMALAENQRILSSSNIASPNSPAFSVPSIDESNSPPPSMMTSSCSSNNNNTDFTFASLDEQTTTYNNASWLHFNQPFTTMTEQIIDHKHHYVFTDCNLNEFCLDFV